MNQAVQNDCMQGKTFSLAATCLLSIRRLGQQGTCIHAKRFCLGAGREFPATLLRLCVLCMCKTNVLGVFYAGRIVTHFLPLEEVLDDAAAALMDGDEGGACVRLSLERGGVPIEAVLPVTDLHAVTPSSLLEISGGTLHALSYQQARNNRAPVGQVTALIAGFLRACNLGVERVLAAQGSALVPKGSTVPCLSAA